MPSIRLGSVRFGYLRPSVLMQDGQIKHPTPARHRMWGLVLGGTFIGVLAKKPKKHPSQECDEEKP